MKFDEDTERFILDLVTENTALRAAMERAVELIQYGDADDLDVAVEVLKC